MTIGPIQGLIQGYFHLCSLYVMKLIKSQYAVKVGNGLNRSRGALGAETWGFRLTDLLVWAKRANPVGKSTFY